MGNNLYISLVKASYYMKMDLDNYYVNNSILFGIIV